MVDTINLALIDDDEAVLDALRLYFTRNSIRTQCFQTTESFLDFMGGGERFDCIVTDVRLPGQSGLDLVRHLAKRVSSAPIILITGHGDIDMAVAAVKAGAFDFIEKPFNESRLLASIEVAVKRYRLQARDAVELEILRAQFEQLSSRQRQVLELAASGLSSKEIGLKLKISFKTVENHRALVMAHLGAHNIADLVRAAVRLQLSQQTVT
jgi:two-component system response regulator FixJ